MADETGWHDAGIVEYQGIARNEIILQIIEMTMLDRLFDWVENHEARGVAWLDRSLSDTFFRQIIIEIGK